MREPTAHQRVFGLMAEFDKPERLMEAVRCTREAGFERVDAHTPFPIEGLAEALAFHDQRVPWFTLLGGIVGAAVGYGLQVYTNQAFPLDIGNRPLVALIPSISVNSGEAPITWASSIRSFPDRRSDVVCSSAPMAVAVRIVSFSRRYSSCVISGRFCALIHSSWLVMIPSRSIT